MINKLYKHKHAMCPTPCVHSADPELLRGTLCRVGHYFGQANYAVYHQRHLKPRWIPIRTADLEQTPLGGHPPHSEGRDEGCWTLMRWPRPASFEKKIKPEWSGLAGSSRGARFLPFFLHLHTSGGCSGRNGGRSTCIPGHEISPNSEA